MKISLITVSYNSDKTIEKTFNSVRIQTYSNVEYIVIDGNSSDNTLNIIKKNQDIISKWISEKDKGIYDAMNKGISLATGDIIGILNSDDFYFDKNVLKKVADCFNKYKVDSVYSDLIYVNKDKLDKIDRFWKSGKYKRSNFLYGWMPAHPTFFVKNEVYKKYGNFDLTISSAADYEFMLRVLFKYRITSKYINFVSVKMRSGGNSNSSLLARIKGNIQDRYAWKKNKIKPYFFTLLLKPLRKIPQYFKYPRNLNISFFV